MLTAVDKTGLLSSPGPDWPWGFPAPVKRGLDVNAC
jgi:hypothetical protein